MARPPRPSYKNSSKTAESLRQERREEALQRRKEARASAYERGEDEDVSDDLIEEVLSGQATAGAVNELFARISSSRELYVKLRSKIITNALQDPLYISRPIPPEGKSFLTYAAQYNDIEFARFLVYEMHAYCNEVVNGQLPVCMAIEACAFEEMRDLNCAVFLLENTELDKKIAKAIFDCCQTAAYKEDGPVLQQFINGYFAPRLAQCGQKSLQELREEREMEDLGDRLDFVLSPISARRRGAIVPQGASSLGRGAEGGLKLPSGFGPSQ